MKLKTGYKILVAIIIGVVLILSMMASGIVSGVLFWLGLICVVILGSVIGCLVIILLYCSIFASEVTT